MKNINKLFTIIFLLFSAANIFSQAASATWALSTTSFLTSVSSGNVTGSAQSMSSGSGQFGMSIFDYNIDGQRLWEGTAGWIAGIEESTRYIQFDALPAGGNTFTVTGISFNYRDFANSINTNTLNSNVYYSTDNWSTRVLLNSTPLQYLNSAVSSFNQTINVTVASGSALSLRIYPYAVINSEAGRPTFAIHNNVVISGSTTVELLDTGSLTGMKFNDLNGNGIMEPNEPGLPNWQISLDITMIAPVTTDANGYYSFSGLPPGTYVVSETNQTGWIQTLPSLPGTYTVTLSEGQSITGLNFGNYLTPVTGCLQPPSGMVAWWPFDETSGSSALDRAGINNVGTHMNSPTPAAGKVAGGLQFNGISQHIEVPDQSELNFGTGNFSIDAWVKTTDISSYTAIIVDKQTQIGLNIYGYSFYLTYGQLTLQLSDGQFTNYGSLVFVADGNWHHIGVTVSRGLSNGILFYKDGVSSPVGDPTMRPGSLNNTGILTIGRQSFANKFSFNGILDEIELFNRVLTPSEMVALYSAGSAGKCKSTTTSVIDDEKTGNNLPKLFHLEQNYPNPFNPASKIRYQIPERSFVSIRVYDLLGKEIGLLTNEEKNPGIYEVIFDAKNLASGIYFYTIRAGNIIQSKKMILLR